MRFVQWAPAFLLLAGCMEDLKTVRLKADGSGTIVYTHRTKEWVVELFRKQGLHGGFTEETAKDRIKKLGAGVELVSTEPSNRDGWIGTTSIYSFKDASTLTFEENNATFNVEPLASGNRKLTVTSHFKRSPNDAKSADSKLPDDLMRALLSGMKFTLAVEVDGTVVSSSSPYVAGSTLTVMEINVDQLFEEEARLKRVAAQDPKTLDQAKETIEALRLLNALQGGEATPEDAAKMLQKIKGVKHALSPTVTLEFTPKK